jgi:hypothetical protein
VIYDPKNKSDPMNQRVGFARMNGGDDGWDKFKQCKLGSFDTVTEICRDLRPKEGEKVITYPYHTQTLMSEHIPTAE